MNILFFQHCDSWRRQFTYPFWWLPILLSVWKVHSMNIWILTSRNFPWFEYCYMMLNWMQWVSLSFKKDFKYNMILIDSLVRATIKTQVPYLGFNFQIYNSYKRKCSLSGPTSLQMSVFIISRGMIYFCCMYMIDQLVSRCKYLLNWVCLSFVRVLGSGTCFSCCCCSTFC